MPLDAEALLRAGLLDGLTLAVASTSEPSAGSVGELVRAAADGLGAVVEGVSLLAAENAEEEEAAAEAAVAAALARAGSLQALVLDGASLFGTQGDRDSLVGCLGRVWNAVRAT